MGQVVPANACVSVKAGHSVIVSMAVASAPLVMRVSGAREPAWREDTA